MPPIAGFDGSQYGAGAPSVIAMEAGMRGVAVLPPERAIEPEPFFLALEKRGFAKGEF